MSSIGQQLAKVRNAKRFSIEDVAFHTRIPAARLRDLENDDLSRFANLVYARGFLKIYSRYLEVDISEYLDQFSTADFAEVSGHEYVQTARATQNLPAAVFTEAGRSRLPGLYILLAGMALVAGIYWWSSRGNDEAAETGEGVSAPKILAKAEPAKQVTVPAESPSAVDAGSGPAVPVAPVSPVPSPPAAAPAKEDSTVAAPEPGPNGAIKAEVVPEE